ncbi:MAG: nucleoside triphosphate pyrophosphohydrolase [Acidobacteriota bacterium]
MTRRSFDELVSLMSTLRAPGGCPWDREQTLADLKPFVIEEAYEVVDAIDREDSEALREEVGDMLLEAVFVAEIARENGSFDVYDAVTAVHDKLVRRHPHVFADVEAKDAEAVLVNWEKLKNEERARESKSLLSGVPVSLPALLKATRLTEKAARVGFDWETPQDVVEKMEEELEELKAAIRSDNRAEIENELGDLFFTLANIARKLKVNSEEALQATNRKFIRRFQAVEAGLRSAGKTFEEATLAEMDAFWNEEKDREKE